MNDPSRVESIFLAALEKATGAARSAYLDDVCKDDPGLREQVNRLLAAHPKAAEFLEQPAGPAWEKTAAYVPAAEQPGKMIAGRYKLLEAIGEGGMGTVWVAEQTEPVRRKVALKLIKAGMDSKSVLARFEAERQALAVMDHPNIAKVLDGGLTDTGRPFFVMEYVKGVPITEYCDATRLSVPQRLNLFVQVCHAVQHAHQKGIIHRDLKPSNIMVAPYDDKPVPKVIDFGLAKAMHQSLTERTLHTAHETVLGTPLYMSPEQAQLNNLDVDTRSDIYSLGVLLYELLTGTTPLEKQRFKEAAWEEIKRIIREEEAPRPSMRLSSSNTLASLAAGRQIEPARLAKLVRGELDWIVMKSLEKDRTRRYESANGFAADVLRYLSGEPVTAAPPSTMYRFQKFVRRNKGKVIASGLVLLALLAGMAGTGWQWYRADQALLAEAERAEGERLAKLDAVAQAEQAQKRLAQIEKANDILGSIFENLDPKEIAEAEKPLQAILVEKLDEAVALLEGESIGDPLVVAAMQNKFGVSLLGLGEPGKAIVILEKARTTYQDKLGPNHLDTLKAMNVLAAAYQQAGKLDLALPLHEETLKLTKASLGPEHPLALTSMGNLAVTYQSAGKLDLALPLFEETLKLRKAMLGPEDPATLVSMSSLALAYFSAGKLDLALPLLEETLKLRKGKFDLKHPDTLTSMSHLATAYQKAGKLDLALPLFEESLQLKKATLGPEHPQTLGTMSNLAGAYMEAGKRDVALSLYEESLQLHKGKLGPEHPKTLATMSNLARAYWIVGKRDLALPLYEETLRLMKTKLGTDHPDMLATMNGLAGVYQAAGKLNLALPLSEETLKLTKAKLGPEHPQTLSSMNSLAQTYRVAKKLDLALPLFEETLKLKKATLGPEHPDTLATMNNLAVAYKAAGKLDLALPLAEETLKLNKAKLGPEHPQTLTSMNVLAVAYQAAGKLDLALPLSEETLKLRKARLGPDHPETLTAMNNLAQVYKDAKKLDLALPLLEESLKLTNGKLGPEHPQTLTIMGNLAGAYKAAGKLDLALPLYEEKLKLRKGTLGLDHPDTLKSMGILVAAYCEASQGEKAAETLREFVAGQGQRANPDDPQFALLLVEASTEFLKCRQYTAAEEMLRGCLGIREKTQPDDWRTFNTQSMLGESLLGQKKYAESEPLLLAGYEGLKQRETTIPPEYKVRLSEALKRLVQLYTDWHAAEPDQGYAAKAADWQTKRDEFNAAATAETPPPADNEKQP